MQNNLNFDYDWDTQNTLPPRKSTRKSKKLSIKLIKQKTRAQEIAEKYRGDREKIKEDQGAKQNGEGDNVI